MSVLIKGMKMPKCCMDCPCFSSTILDDEQWCGAMRRGLGKYFKQCIALRKRHDDCPLIEVNLVAQEELITPLNMIGGYLEKAEGSDNG